MRLRRAWAGVLIAAVALLGFVPSARAALSTPTGLTATAVSSSRIDLAWSDSNPTETGFAIERAAALSGPFSQIATTGKNVTAWSNTGLAASTTYFYRVRATGRKSTFSAYSNVASATTAAATGSDTTPPSVSISSPPNGTTYTSPQTVTVTSSASDNVSVTRVDFYDNGVLRGSDTTSPYGYAWSFTSSSNGSHSWTARAWDAANNSTLSSAVGTTVNIPAADTTPPTVSITSPASGTTYSSAQTVTINASASDNVAVARVEFIRDSVLVGSDTIAPYSAAWAITSADNGAHTWSATAYDAAGNYRDATAITLNVNIPVADTTPPSIPTGLSATAAACSQIDLTWNPSTDNAGGSGLKGYSVYRNGVYLKQVLAPATSTSDAGLSGSTTYSFAVSAVDNANNASSQSVAAGATTPGCSAAGGEHLWSRDFGGPSVSATARPNSVVTDGAGNVLVAGYFRAVVDFGGGSLTSAGAQDIFLAKFSPTGEHLWSMGIGSTGNDTANGIAVDATGNVFVTGSYEGTVDFGGGPLTSGGGADIFLAKFSPTGGHVWSRPLGKSVGFSSGSAVAVDGSGNVVATGYFSGSVDLGAGQVASAGSNDVFVLKYSATGGHLWSRRVGGTGYEASKSIAVDGSGNVVVTGYYAGAGDFGAGAVNSVSGSYDIFVVKYLGTNGNPEWSKVPGTTGDDRGIAVDIDSGGNTILTGYYNGSLDLGGGALPYTGGAVDILLVKYDAAGGHVWSKGFGTSSAYGDSAAGVAVDAAGNVVVTGSLFGAVNFGGGALFGSGSDDIFIAKFNGQGSHLWSKRFGPLYPDGGTAVATDSGGNVLAAGFFTSSVDFGGGALTSPGGNDGYLVKFGP